MEASPKLSTIDQATEHGDRNDEIPKSYTHYQDRIASKEGHRVGVYWTSGDHYVGEWHLNLRHGRGIHWYRSGSIYEGEWRNGKKNGYGTFWIKEPSRNYYIRKYRGSWKDNKYGGHGCCYGLGGEQYNGNRDWNSKDVVKYHTYYGNWVDGKRTGLGQLTMSNGNVYQGEWKNDWKEGMGVFFKDKQSKFPSVSVLNQKCLKLAASRQPPPWYDKTKQRTDPAVCTKKFSRADIVYGSALHGPLQNPNL